MGYKLKKKRLYPIYKIIYRQKKKFCLYNILCLCTDFEAIHEERCFNHTRAPCPAVESVTVTSHSTIVKMWWSQSLRSEQQAETMTQTRLMGKCPCFLFICVKYSMYCILFIFK